MRKRIIMKYTEIYSLEEKKDLSILLGRIGEFSLKIGEGKNLRVTLSCDREDAKKLFQSQLISHGTMLELRVKKHRNAIKASLGRTLSVAIEVPKGYGNKIFLQVTPEQMDVDQGLNIIEVEE